MSAAKKNTAKPTAASDGTPPVRYRILHTTDYYYGESVLLCHNVVRLRPRDTAYQTCVRSDLTVSPAAAARRDRVDYFGNHATWVSVQEPHEVLRIECRSEVEVRPIPSPGSQVGPPWERVPAIMAEPNNPLHAAAREHTFDSRYVKADAALAEFARPFFTPGRPLLPCVMDLTQCIFREFTFDSEATMVGTPVLEVLRNHRGVCQDFAHLQIGCLRSFGIPARYVSGYVLTQPPPGKKRLVGADASHAWVAAFIPGFGWMDFDPTNGIVPSTEHVTLGWGRDYDDVSPVRGIIVGGHRHSMYFGVTMEPIEPEELPAEANLTTTPDALAKAGVQQQFASPG